MPDVLAHLAHANQVRGGAMLFSENVSPVLDLAPFLNERLRGRRPLDPNVRETKAGGKRRTRANSAEAIREMKRAHGKPIRPTTEPVDVWAKRGSV